jgi:glycine cleavage system aminomethyltransferase T
MGYLRNTDGVTNAWVKEGTYEIKVEGKMIPATVHSKSPYDPDNQRTRM